MKETPYQHKLNIEDILKEYEGLLYIISHDFNASLRQIREFLKLLISDLEKQRLSKKNREYIDFINSSLKRISMMQDTVLSLSRVRTKGQHFSSV